MIEAAPERLELKHELLAALSEIVCARVRARDEHLLAARDGDRERRDARPERVVGMHFFNPAPLMRLLEVVAGEQSGERALALAEATGGRWARP